MLTHVTFVNISLPAVDKALLYLSRCPNLECLDIRMPCEGRRIYELFKTSKKLRALIISKDIRLSQKLLIGFLADLPALERIESHATTLSPDNIMWPTKLPNLKVIALSSEEVRYLSNQIPPLHICDNDNVWGLYLFLKEICVLINPLQVTLYNSIPNLEELSLCWRSPHLSRYPFGLTAAGLPSLRRLDLSGMYLTANADLPPNLEYLRFHNCTIRPSFPEDPLLKLPNLHSIIFENSASIALHSLRILLDASEGALRYFHLDSGISEFTEIVVEMLAEAPASKGLRELILANMYGLADSHVCTLLKNMPELRVLHVPYTGITGCTIKTIAEARLASSKEAEGENPDSFQKRIPNIEQVDIRGCENLSSDAVDYGRARGIKIIK